MSRRSSAAPRPPPRATSTSSESSSLKSSHLLALHVSERYQRRACTARLASVGKKSRIPSPVTHLAGKSVSLPPVRAESSTPRGGGAGDPLQPRGCGGESPQVWRSVDVYASPTANPVGAKWNVERTPRMSGCPRDLAVARPLELIARSAPVTAATAQAAAAAKAGRAVDASILALTDPAARPAARPCRRGDLAALAGPLTRPPAGSRAAVRAGRLACQARLPRRPRGPHRRPDGEHRERRRSQPARAPDRRRPANTSSSSPKAPKAVRSSCCSRRSATSKSTASSGPKPRRRCESFQASSGLSVDGIVGPQTSAALRGGSAALPDGLDRQHLRHRTGRPATSPTRVAHRRGDRPAPVGACRSCSSMPSTARRRQLRARNRGRRPPPAGPPRPDRRRHRRTRRPGASSASRARKP